MGVGGWGVGGGGPALGGEGSACARGACTGHFECPAPDLQEPAKALVMVEDHTCVWKVCRRKRGGGGDHSVGLGHCEARVRRLSANSALWPPHSLECELQSFRRVHSKTSAILCGRRAPALRNPSPSLLASGWAPRGYWGGQAGWPSHRLHAGARVCCVAGGGRGKLRLKCAPFNARGQLGLELGLSFGCPGGDLSTYRERPGCACPRTMAHHIRYQGKTRLRRFCPVGAPVTLKSIWELGPI